MVQVDLRMGLFIAGSLLILLMVLDAWRRGKLASRLQQFDKTWSETGESDKDWDAVMFDHEQTDEESQTPETDAIISLGVLASEDHLFDGKMLKAAFRSCNLVFTSKGVFQRMDMNQNVYFQVVSMLEPGTFDMQTLVSEPTPGILLFMELPMAGDPVAAIDDLITTAEYLAEQLSGTLCDGQRRPITRQNLKNYRDRVQVYRAKKGSVVSA